MERQKLSEHAQQRVYYIQKGCNQDGLEITTLGQLTSAFGFVVLALKAELGEDCEAYLDTEVRPYIERISSKFSEL
jgi:hypothetical protein